MTEQEPWQWDEATWRGHVNRVRAGARLVPERWPGGARVAVGISFDPDHETIPLRDGETRPGTLAQGEYGARVAVPKILRMLAEHAVPASFFMPAVSALLHPGEVAAYAAGGHEVGVHGWIHERNMLLARERRAGPHRSGRRDVGEAERRAAGGHPDAVLGLLRPHPGHHPRSSASPTTRR